MNPLVKSAVEEAPKIPEKTVFPVKVLLSVRSVEEAAATVADPPREIELPLIVTEEYWSWLLPMVEEAMTWPFGLTARSDEVRPVKARFVVVAFVVVPFTAVKFCNVEDA